MNITHRPRRLRKSRAMRSLVRETSLQASSLILPVFVKEGIDSPKEIKGLKGVFQHSLESFAIELEIAKKSGIGGVMIFAIPLVRDELGAEAINPHGILHQAVTLAKSVVGEELVIVADLCLDAFTSHGHCGVLDGQGRIDNDRTLAIYQEMAVQLAEAGADILGTSGMMDGQVGAVRSALDLAGLSDTAILAYGAKFASALYGPFRNAVDSALQGDRKSYQADSANMKDAMREIELDVAEGADIIMVKPGLLYFDVLHAASQFVNVPLATYIVSGEMAMVEYAAENGAIDRKATIIEIALSAKRAGAGIICTYWALEIAHWLREEATG